MADRTSIEQAKLMLDAKVVVEHYDRIVAGIDPAIMAKDGPETDFVMTVSDYETLRDFALQEHAARKPKPHPTVSMTFEGLVLEGLRRGANIVNGMPWSFEFGHGWHVTHENDTCYLVCRGAVTLRMTPDDTLIRLSDGDILVYRND